MNRWFRLLKHRWHDEADARRALGAGAAERLRKRVADSELGHSGEIRICVEVSLPLSRALPVSPALPARSRRT